MFAKVIDYRFTRICHKFHEGILGGHFPPIRTTWWHTPCKITMNLTLTNLPRCTANRNIFERSTKTAHGMSLKMRKYNHRIIIYEMTPHCDFLQMLTISHRQTMWP